MIYLDNSATTPMLPEVIEAITKVQQNYIGNPSSLHHLGVKSQQLLQKAKQQMAQLLQIKPEEIIVTSGGTESNNTALLGTAFAKKGKHIITTTIEHPSIKKTMQFLGKLGYDITYLPVDLSGKIDVETLKNAITDETILVSVMWVNNEVGFVQPIKEIATLLKQYPKIHFHVDAVQAVSQVFTEGIPDRVDLLSLSAHKFHGPRGIGMLYKKSNRKIEPLLHGGGQESGWRSGTENTANIVGMAKALRMYAEKESHTVTLKQDLMTFFKTFDQVEVFSTEEGADHIVTLAIKGVRGEVVVHALEDYDIYVSTTSACSSKTYGHNTLSAIGVTKDLGQSAFRISLSQYTTSADIEQFKQVFKTIYEKFSKTMGK